MSFFFFFVSFNACAYSHLQDAVRCNPMHWLDIYLLWIINEGYLNRYSYLLQKWFEKLLYEKNLNISTVCRENHPIKKRQMQVIQHDFSSGLLGPMAVWGHILHTILLPRYDWEKIDVWWVSWTWAIRVLPGNCNRLGCGERNRDILLRLMTGDTCKICDLWRSRPLLNPREEGYKSWADPSWKQ